MNSLFTPSSTALVVASSFIGLLSAPTYSTATVDPDLPLYQLVSGVSGNLNSIGSDTLNNLIANK